MSLLEGIENGLSVHETSIRVGLEMKEDIMTCLKDLVMKSVDGRKVGAVKVRLLVVVVVIEVVEGRIAERWILVT